MQILTQSLLHGHGSMHMVGWAKSLSCIFFVKTKRSSGDNTQTLARCNEANKTVLFFLKKKGAMETITQVCFTGMVVYGWMN